MGDLKIPFHLGPGLRRCCCCLRYFAFIIRLSLHHGGFAAALFPLPQARQGGRQADRQQAGQAAGREGRAGAELSFFPSSSLSSSKHRLSLAHSLSVSINARRRCMMLCGQSRA